MISTSTRKPTKTMKHSLLALTSSVALLAQLPLAAHAGRPLGTDDAATAGANTCQIESWLERGAGPKARTWVLSPACGLGEAVELNVELARTVPDDGIRFESGLAVKWVDPAWKAGPLHWGFKAWRGTAHRRHAPRRAATASGAMGLLTWRAGEAVAVHGNFGFEKDHASRRNEPLINLAFNWDATPSLTLVAEAMALRHGPTQRNLGARWWLQPERLALDLTAGRSTGAAPTRNVTIGLGWYGIGW